VRGVVFWWFSGKTLSPDAKNHRCPRDYNVLGIKSIKYIRGGLGDGIYRRRRANERDDNNIGIRRYYDILYYTNII